MDNGTVCSAPLASVELEGNHAVVAADSSDQPTAVEKKTPSKRKRKHSGGGGKHHAHYRPPHKKLKQDVSSTRAADNIMRFRLRGSVSDPLNLEGGDLDLADECSTCAPSPAMATNEELIPPPLLLTPQLSKDPLNLEGKVKNFPLLSKVYVAVL